MPKVGLTKLFVLLIRELLDNQERVESSNKWFLRSFLDQLVDIAKSH